MYLLNKIAHIDKKAMYKAAKLVHTKSGKNTVSVLFDMIYCGLKYKAGYNDYVEFEFYNMDRNKRQTYLTQGKNNSIMRRYNNKSFAYVLNDKIEFNKKFDRYLNRAWLDISDISMNDFKDFILYYNRIVGKVIDGEGGIGVDI